MYSFRLGLGVGGVLLGQDAGIAFTLNTCLIDGLQEIDPSHVVLESLLLWLLALAIDGDC